MLTSRELKYSIQHLENQISVQDASSHIVMIASTIALVVKARDRTSVKVIFNKAESWG